MNVSSLKDIFTVDFLEKRNDSVASRWNMMFGSKMILMIVVITSWCWSKDKMNCLKSEEGPYPKFVTKSCWMRGLFLYKELIAEPRPSREFGTPVAQVHRDRMQNNDKSLLFVVPMGTLSLLEFFIFSFRYPI